MFQIISAQSQTQTFHRNNVSAATISQQMTAPACFFNSAAAPSGHSRAGSADDCDSIFISECCGQSGISVTSNFNCGSGPDPLCKSQQIISILLIYTTGQENSDVRRFLRKMFKHPFEL